MTKGNDGVARPILYSFPSLLGFLSGTDDEEGRIDRANPILLSVSRPAFSLSFARLRERHDAWHGRTKRGRYLSRLQKPLEMPGKPEGRLSGHLIFLHLAAITIPLFIPLHL